MKRLDHSARILSASMSRLSVQARTAGAIDGLQRPNCGLPAKPWIEHLENNDSAVNGHVEKNMSEVKRHLVFRRNCVMSIPAVVDAVYRGGMYQRHLFSACATKPDILGPGVPGHAGRLSSAWKWVIGVDALM